MRDERVAQNARGRCYCRPDSVIVRVQQSQDLTGIFGAIHDIRLNHYAQLQGIFGKHAFFQSPEEEGIPFHISPPAFAIILTRIEFLPHACREYMLVPFVPSPVHHFGKVGVVGSTFKM